MRPDQPHSFVPRNPSTAEGRTTCECGLGADADVHLRAQLAASLGKCRDCLERPSARKGRCWKCYKATLPGSSEVTLSTTLSAKMAEEVDREVSRLGVSRSAWIRTTLLRRLGELSDAASGAHPPCQRWSKDSGPLAKGLRTDAPGHADQQVPEG